MKIIQNNTTIEDVTSNNDCGSDHSKLKTSEFSPLLAKFLAAPSQLNADLTFRSRIPVKQQCWINLTLASLGLGMALQPALFLHLTAILLFAAFFLILAWRSFILFAGLITRTFGPNHNRPQRSDVDLPIYSVLVPAYREFDLMAQLAGALNRLNWPSDRLDILLLLETDDPETLEAARVADFPQSTRVCLVPSGGPRTKPNALNLGLEHAQGRYVTVYDVEDIPHPDQLRVAFDTFTRAPAQLVCVQAPLIADNAGQNWLAAQWALEYDVQFGLLLPGLALYRMPLLLGGTSNHFRKDALLALGGWDAWNVTEDADLGMRIARASLCATMIAPPTFEDAPVDLTVWMAQRTRWIKGHLQTWLVLMRAPRTTLRQMGLAEFLAMQLSLGSGILAPIFFAPCMAMVILSLLSADLELGLFGRLLLSMGVIVGLLSGIAAPGPWTFRRWIAILTRGFYWPLHTIAAYRAIWELAKRPFFWAKTPHQPRSPEPAKNCSTGSSA